MFAPDKEKPSPRSRERAVIEARNAVPERLSRRDVRPSAALQRATSAGRELGNPAGVGRAAAVRLPRLLELLQFRHLAHDAAHLAVQQALGGRVQFLDLRHLLLQDRVGGHRCAHPPGSRSGCAWRRGCGRRRTSHRTPGPESVRGPVGAGSRTWRARRCGWRGTWAFFLSDASQAATSSGRGAGPRAGPCRPDTGGPPRSRPRAVPAGPR